MTYGRHEDKVSALGGCIAALIAVGGTIVITATIYATIIALIVVILRALGIL